MTYEVDIRWTPRTALHKNPDKDSDKYKGASFFPDLTRLLVTTLKPFPEAREALCLALVAFDEDGNKYGYEPS
jgi:hypothetical protein